MDVISQIATYYVLEYSQFKMQYHAIPLANIHTHKQTHAVTLAPHPHVASSRAHATDMNARTDSQTTPVHTVHARIIVLYKTVILLCQIFAYILYSLLQTPAGSEEDWLCWQALNRLRTGVGRAKTVMRKWGYLDDAQSVDCDCGEPQAMAHLLSCRLLDEACTADDLATVTEQAKACARKWEKIV